MIDICDFAVGLSRQLYGRTMPSERPGHRLMETWHPLGVVGVISAFNFPAAVWSWNTAVALVCGDPVVWKPSELTPADRRWPATPCSPRRSPSAARPTALSQVVLGGRRGRPGAGRPPRRRAAQRHRLDPDGPRRRARAWPSGSAASLLELGGNNAAVVAPSADLDLAVRGIVFSAAGTAGQRCTTMRRVIAHRSVVDELTERLASAYERLPIGNPMADGTLVGPLIHRRRVRRDGSAPSPGTGRRRQAGRRRRPRARGRGARRLLRAARDRADATSRPTWCARETFAPLLYVLPYDDFDEAIALNNAVPQGLSSSVFTTDQAEAERFLSAEGSDCGIVNVNIGTSGAEIGGAFGGEKETGGGRESGSDAWRAYMRRATNTINFSGELPLAQGVDFTV